MEPGSDPSKSPFWVRPLVALSWNPAGYQGACGISGVQLGGAWQDLRHSHTTVMSMCLLCPHLGFQATLVSASPVLLAYTFLSPADRALSEYGGTETPA